MAKIENTFRTNINKNEGAPDSFCPLPWTHVSIKGNGAYRVCCHSAASESRQETSSSEESDTL